MNYKNRLVNVLSKDSSKNFNSSAVLLEEICDFIKNFDGVLRKNPIADISKIFEKTRETYGNCVVDIGDDSAVIDIGTD